MLDLGSLPTTAGGKISRVVPKKDPDGGVGSIMWDIELVFELNNLSDAKVLDGIVSGASSVYESGQLGGKAEVKDQSEYEVLRCILFCNGTRQRLCSTHAEIRQSLVRCNGPKSVFLLRLRLYGVITDQAIKIVNRIEEEVTIYLGSVGVGKIQSIDDALQRVAQKNKGSLVISNDEEAFLVVEEQPHSYTVENSNGGTLELSKEEVKNMLLVQSCDGFNYVDEYRKICAENSIDPDLMCIVKALIAEFALGNISSSDGKWNVTTTILQKATTIDGDFGART